MKRKRKESLRKWNAVKMLKKSLFVGLLKTKESRIQRKIIIRMQRLIQECKFKEKANYAHLSNILGALAIYQVEKENGVAKQTILDEIENKMRCIFYLRNLLLSKIFNIPYSFFLFKKIFPMIMKKKVGKGWKLTFYKQTRNTCRFDVTECIYHNIFSKYEVPELGPLFCRMDHVLYYGLRNMDFVRKGTLCNGARRCDFLFRKENKNV